MTRKFRKLGDRLAAFGRDTLGAAAVEFAVVVSFLVIPLLNATDLGFYAFERMQVENAAQMGAQEAWRDCGTLVDFAAGCPLLGAPLTTAIQSTPLGAAVSGSSTEGYYCTTTSGALQSVATPPLPPPLTCAGVTGASDQTAPPGDYVKISVSYAFAPVFPAVSVAALLPTPITMTTWTRTN